ncbi:MAG: hypothetical protein QXD94_01250 [Sulfolobales archaeon]
MVRTRLRLDATLLLTKAIILLLITMHTAVISAQPTYSLNIYIDNYGVTYVTLNAYLTQGINKLELPVKALDNTISVTCNDKVLPSILTNDGELYTTSNESCTAIITYIADVTSGNILTLGIFGNTTAKIVLDEKVLILNISENIISATKEDNKTVIIAKTPTILNYVLFEPTTQTVTITKPATQTTETTTQLTTQTTQTATPTQTLGPLNAIALIALIAIISALIIVVKKK